MVENDILFQAIADKWLLIYFDGMPSVPITLGKPESFRNGVMAHYLPSMNAIELHPLWAHDGINFGDIKNSIKHELAHAWVHWKGLKGVVLKDGECGGHNEYFLWKAHELKVDIDYLFAKYPQALPVWQRIQSSWKPSLEIKKEVPRKIEYPKVQPKPVVKSLITKSPGVTVRRMLKITSVNPMTVYTSTGGARIVLVGTYFNTVNAVTLNGIPVECHIESAERMTIITPPYPRLADILVLSHGEVHIVISNGWEQAFFTIKFV
jgi:hypothetical protein